MKATFAAFAMLVMFVCARSGSAETYVLVDSASVGGSSICVFDGTVYVLGSGITALSLDLVQLGGWSAQGRSVSANADYVCVAGSGVTWYSPDGTLLAASNAGKDYVAIDASGRTIARSATFDSMLVELLPSGTVVRYWFDHKQHIDNHLRDMAFAPDGDIYIVDYFDGDATTGVNRFRLGPAGEEEYTGGFSTQGQCIGPGNDRPEVFSLGVDPLGNGYAVDYCDNAVEKHSSSGALITRWSHDDRINDVAGDAFGNAYVLTGSHVWKYAPEATTPVQRTSLGAVKSRWDSRRAAR